MSMGPTWRVVIADDEPLARRTLRDLLAERGGFELVGECRTGNEVIAAVDRLPPSSRDAARLSGVHGVRAWRRLTWPLLRPAMARAAGLAFAASLVDPGPPLLLGLRRSLGFQLVAGVRDAPFTRVTAIALISVLTCVLARFALFLWSGSDRRIRAAGPDRSEFRPTPAPSRVRTALGGLALGLGLVPLLGTAVGLAALFAPGDFQGTVRPLVADPTIVGVLSRSVVLGIGVVLLTAVSDRLLGWLEAGAGAAATNRRRRLVRAVAPPPLAAGVVVLAFLQILKLC